MKEIDDIQYTLEDFYYDLPDELIAQTPASKRDDSRLFVLDRQKEEFTHSSFRSIADFLRPGDVLVFNNARVINARIFCKRESGGKVEIVLAQRESALRWQAISNRTKKLREGEIIHPLKNESIELKVCGRDGEYLIIESGVELTDSVLENIGEVPLPPYIKRDSDESDDERYQTIYASKSGAVAAPTAGLHFTDDILQELKDKNVELLFLTLMVSWGTFSPVRENQLSKHNMHTEKYVLEESIAEKINRGRKEGRRIIAVGTTSLRVLESTYENGENHPGSGETSIFIYPPYKIKSIDAMITNFHTPYSTLLMLVSALAGYDLILKAYREAVDMEYRFFSYGDSMFIC